jgi:hypothetical protein
VSERSQSYRGIFDRLDTEFDKRYLQPDARRVLLEGWQGAGLPASSAAGPGMLGVQADGKG